MLTEEKPAIATKRPLAVDLDGTLFHGDLFTESMLRYVFAAPWRMFILIGWLMKGRAYAKARLAEAAPFDPADLPYDQRFLDWLKMERKAGRTLVLATASDRRAAKAVADYLGIFDAVFASDGVVNLKSARKAERLAAAFPEGFAYAGNEPADVKVWRAAKNAVIVNASRGLTVHAGKLAAVEEVFPLEASALRGLIEAIRPRQWVKNSLVFLPMLVGQAWMAPQAWVNAVIAFIALCFAASSICLLDDASNIDADRRHPRNRTRPIASGALSPMLALPIAALFAGGGIALGFLAGVAPLIGLYLAVSLLSTFWLKGQRILDMFLIASLYVIRIVIGGVATGDLASALKPVLYSIFAVIALTACTTAPIDPHKLHERILTLDTHLDTPMNLERPGWDIAARHDDGYTQVDLPRMIEGGLDGGFWAIYTPQGPRTPEGIAAAHAAAERRLTLIKAMIAAHPDQFAEAHNAADAARIAAQGKRIVYLSIENAYPWTGHADELPRLYQSGVRMLGLVHTTNNDLADSATDRNGPEWHGLSPQGRVFVAEANRLGMIVDASHASDEVFDQLLTLSKTPIILSHSGVHALYDHPRNISDERLRALAASGGVIQINSLGSYIAHLEIPPERTAALAQLRAQFGPLAALPPAQRDAYDAARRAIDARYPPPMADFEDFMRQLLHALEIAGPDHVGIGADWDGGGGVHGMNDVSALPKITERLLAAGYTERQIANIWSGNVLRLLRHAEQYAAQQKTN